MLDGPTLDGSYCYWNHDGSGTPLVQVNGSVVDSDIISDSTASNQSSDQQRGGSFERTSEDSSPVDITDGSDVSATSPADVERSGNSAGTGGAMPPSSS